jgi:copper chaperone CopZ
VQELKVSIEGMHCQKCVERVQKALAKVPGVAVGNVDVGSAKLQYDEVAANPAAIVQAIDKAGYKAHPQT